jgi:hypothetical protein
MTRRNVYVRSQKAGERILAWMRTMYDRLHLRVNEKKTEVGPVFGRKFLGYCVRRWTGGSVTVDVAPKAPTRSSSVSGSSPDVSVAKACSRLPNRCGNTCRAGSHTSVWRKPRRYSKIWIHGYDTVSVPFNSSTGVQGRLSTVARCTP